MSEWNVVIQDIDFGSYTDILIWRRAPDGKREVIGPGGVVHPKDDNPISDEDIFWRITHRLVDDILQPLMDELWEKGYRPKSGRRYEEEINLKDNHLQDMRKIVFKEKADE